VQQLSDKDLGRGPEVKALARGVVVGGEGLAEAAGRDFFEVCVARGEAAHAADGVLDAAFLPG